MDTIDLVALAHALPDDYQRLKGLIQTTRDVFSARSDLRIACDHAARASEYIATPPPLPPEAVEEVVMALTTSAIVFYARATKSTSDHRKTFDLRPLFDDAEKETHDYLCRLRDDAIAHFGPGPLGDAVELRSDHIMLPPPWTRMVLVSRHIYGVLEFSDRLGAHARRATLLMQRIFEAKEGKLVEALNQCADDEAVQAAVETARASFGETIGNEAVAQAILDGPRVGHARVTTSGQGARGRPLPRR